MTEDEMVGQCHRIYQHEFDQTPGGSGREEGLECSGPCGHEDSDTTKQLNNNNKQPALHWHHKRNAQVWCSYEQESNTVQLDSLRFFFRTILT